MNFILIDDKNGGKMLIRKPPMDRWGSPYTDDRVRSLARAHVAYGWSPSPGGHGGDPWTKDLERSYMDEYRKQVDMMKGGRP